MNKHLGRYQLIRKLASGGMAEVFLAKTVGPGGFEKTLVVKRIHSHLAEDRTFSEMFLAEARLAAALNHPNIVQIFDFGEADGSYFLAMEHIDGPDLSRWVQRAGVRPLPPALCAAVVAAAAEGLAFAHDFRNPATGEALGLIHRDVSPQNILVSRQGAVKVVDFGIAKATSQRSQTQPGVVKGKLAYMPPEQLQGGGLDRRTDVYALGVVLYELLTGRRLFDAATPERLVKAILFEPLVPAVHWRPDLPAALQEVLARALAKERETRYPDCRAMQRDLERFVRSEAELVSAYHLGEFVESLPREEASTAAPPASAVPREPTETLVTERPTQSLRGRESSAPRTEEAPRPSTQSKRSRQAVLALAGVAALVGGSAFVPHVLQGSVAPLTAEASMAPRAVPRVSPPRGEVSPPAPASEAGSEVPRVEAEKARETSSASPASPTNAGTAGAGSPKRDTPRPPLASKATPRSADAQVQFFFHPFGTLVLDGAELKDARFDDDEYMNIEAGSHQLRFFNTNPSEGAPFDVEESFRVEAGQKCTVSIVPTQVPPMHVECAVRSMGRGARGGTG